MIIRSPMRDILQMLTLDDVAGKLNVPVSDVRVLIETDRLPHYRLGHHGEQIRIIRRDLAAFGSNAQASHSHSDESFTE